jgi:ABC-type amino acid transport substrate-binding protein
VGTLKGTQLVDYLAKAGIHVKTYESIKDGLKAVYEKELDAFVQDEAIVKSLVKKDFLRSLRILPEIFDKRYVSMAMPEGSILREPLNRALLKVTETDQWKDLLQRYLGPGK